MEEHKLKLNLADKDIPILSGHLKMGGKNPSGGSINANSLFLTINEKPVLPVMGEFHFSRFPHQYWEEEILKMKACGINIIATYIFWIHHEEIEGQWDWSGDKNLRKFVQLCAENDLYVFPRIGPYAHGECRNGGFPDWMWEMSDKRTDDPEYLSYTRKLYQQIFQQVKGLLYKDGGPVIGIQVENEYWFGKAGEKHMMTLKNMAREIGFNVPLYTVTGWKEASVVQDEFIPVFGSYADLPWELHTDKLPPVPEYFFHHIRNNEIMDENLTLQPNGYNVDFSRYPFSTCEIGSGIQITYHRRPVVSADDVCALSMVKIGNGSNLMGYFVFHGGTHPDGVITTMQEVYGRPYKLEYPVKSYDFQAPIGEFGQINDSYYGFKKLHLFLNDFGDYLAPMISVLPDSRPKHRSDKDNLRFAARVKDDSGFLFFNNYQRLTKMNDFENCRVELDLKNEKLTLPRKNFSVKNSSYFIWPFNLQMNDALLKYSTSQLLCKIKNDSVDTYFFFFVNGIEPEYAFDSNTIQNIKTSNGREISENGCTYIENLSPGLDSIIQVKSKSGKKINIITLTSEMAETCWKGSFDGTESVFMSKANMLFGRKGITVYSRESSKMHFDVYPPLEDELFDDANIINSETNGVFRRYILSKESKDSRIVIKKSHEVGEWNIQLPKDAFEGINDLFLRIHYTGDTACMYINKKLAADNFYNGLPWEIGLKRFAREILNNGLTIRIAPNHKNSKIYLEDWAKDKNGKQCGIDKIEIIPEYSANVSLQMHKAAVLEKRRVVVE